MIGPKKLADIIRELRRTLKKSAPSLESWLDKKIADLEPDAETKPTVLEDLLWVRKLLRDSRGAKRASRGQPSKTARKKKTPIG